MMALAAVVVRVVVVPVLLWRHEHGSSSARSRPICSMAWRRGALPCCSNDACSLCVGACGTGLDEVHWPVWRG